MESTKGALFYSRVTSAVSGGAVRPGGVHARIANCVDVAVERMRCYLTLCLLGFLALLYAVCTLQDAGQIRMATSVSRGRAVVGHSGVVVQYRRSGAELLTRDPKQRRPEVGQSADGTSGRVTSKDEAADDAYQRQSDEPGDLDPSKVLLLTYYRGGSTFLGETFNRNEDVFYWFEPLAAPLATYKKNHGGADYVIDGREYPMIRPTDLVNTLLHVINDILNCDVTELDTDVKRHYFALAWHKSEKFGRYRSCMAPYRLLHGNNVTERSVARCQRYLVKPCRRSNIRVIKSIRLFVDEIFPLARYDPDVKFVYYVRDPRGILLSRWSLSKRPLSDIPLEKIDQMAAYLCAKMRADLQAVRQFRMLYPDRLLVTSYEELATAPEPTIARLYDFVGVNTPPEVIDWVRYATHARKSNGLVGTIRENSSAVATRWRRELLPIHLSIIDEHCSDVIDQIYEG